MNSLNRCFFGMFIFIFSHSMIAGNVRTIITDDSKMNNVFLKLGQSTVLRFKGEKPKRVVIGNKNYYNIEFVENSRDVTLQPLQSVSTNLFVYCEKRTYGFLLKTRNSGHYDDLINVKWKSKDSFKRSRGNTIVLDEISIKSLSHRVEVGKNLFADSFKVRSFKNKKTIIVDFQLQNFSNDNIELENLNVFASRRKSKLPRQTFVIVKKELSKMSSTKVRVAVTLKIRKGFTLNFVLRDTAKKIIINKRFLR